MYMCVYICVYMCVNVCECVCGHMCVGTCMFMFCCSSKPEVIADILDSRATKQCDKYYATDKHSFKQE